MRDDEMDTADDLHDRRSAQWHHDDDGSFVLSARLTPEQGALVRQALEAALEAVDNGSAEPLSTGRDSKGQRQADALVAMAEPHPPLGRRRRDQPGQPHVSVPEASPGRARGYTAEATADPHHPVRFRRPDGTVLAGHSGRLTMLGPGHGP